jgi:hypothetical protein
MPNLEKFPNDGDIWHFEHMPLPPHTLSRSTFNCLAAASTVVPLFTIPLLPDGRNITVGSDIITSFY